MFKKKRLESTNKFGSGLVRKIDLKERKKNRKLYKLQQRKRFRFENKNIQQAVIDNNNNNNNNISNINNKNSNNIYNNNNINNNNNISIQNQSMKDNKF